MIKLLPLFFLVFASHSLGAGNVPDAIPNSTELEARVRIFYPIDEWSLYSEVQFSDQSQNREYRSIMLGSYYRWFAHLRTGLFYQRQYGFRHDEDWFKHPVTLWQWQDTHSRGEDLMILDVSPKWELPFLPGNGWTIEAKTRLSHNFFNQHKLLRFRPNLSYFWIRDEIPFMSFFLLGEFVFPISEGIKPMNERWGYFGALYHFNSRFQLGAYTALKWESWKNTESFQALTGKTYQVEANSAVFGLLMVMQLSEGE